MKIKIFPYMDINNLEDEINQFVKNKKIIDIKFTSVAHGDISDGINYIQNAMILYEDD